MWQALVIHEQKSLCGACAIKALDESHHYLVVPVGNDGVRPVEDEAETGFSTPSKGARMFTSKTQPKIETSGTRSAEGQRAQSGDSTPKRRGPTRSRTMDPPVTEETLGEMGRALARRLNALVDALDQQEPKP